jgi:catechol 2,3-dioxygenase-like lactoylglutathione lyase family enzyme
MMGRSEGVWRRKRRPRGTRIMIKLTRIAETALYVDDLARAVEFYTELFGCEVLRRDDRFCALRVAVEEVLLLFLRCGSLEAHTIPGGLIPSHDGSGPLHVCFGIEDGELEAWAKRLEEHGIAIESRVTWPTGARSLYFRDPDQHAVELATPRVWG